MADQTIHSQSMLRGDLYTEVVDITLDADTGSGTWKTKLVKPLGASVVLNKTSTPSAETFAVSISGRTIVVYSSSATSASRVFVIVKGYRY